MSDPASAPASPSGAPTEQRMLPPGIALGLDLPGDGHRDRVLLYLHGLGSSRSGAKAEFFRRRFVDAGCAFCAIDFRGHGDSDGTTLDLTLSRNIEDARLARDHLTELGFGRIDVMGSSLGGLTALWLCRLYPERIRSGAHIAPALGIEAKMRATLGEAGLEHWRSEGRLPYTNEVGTIDIGYGFVEDLARYPEAELADGYDVPTLLIQGELDESVDWRMVQRFADRVASVDLELWPDGDHRLNERLDEVWSHVRSFFTL